MPTGLTRTRLHGPPWVIVERCLALGVPTVRCDAGGGALPAALSGPRSGSSVVQAWMRSPFIGRRLRDAAAQWNEEDRPAPAELFPGCWALPMPELHRRRRIGYVVGFALAPEAVGCEESVAACQSAGLDALAVQSALAPYAVHDGASVSRTALMLAWAQEDLREIARSEEALGSFSAQLGEAYEEIALLYKLGRSMNELAQPAKFVRLLCDELDATLSFGWTAAWFVAEARDAGTMASRCIVSGEPPCGRDALRAQVTRLMQSLPSDRASVVTSESDADGLLGPLGPNLLVHPFRREGRLIGALLAGDKKDDESGVSSADMKVLDAAGAYLNILLENATLYEDQHAMFLGTLRALTSSIDAKDPYTRGHSERVAYLAQRLAQAAGLDESLAERVWICGLVHDVGKIGVPEAVLRKPGRLTDEEFRLIQAHPEIGHRILKDIPQLADVLPGVLHHHERWDGRGYPGGVRGEEIPLFARLIALADSFDAMSSDRTYRGAMPRRRALDEIVKCAGAQFDPALTPLFVGLDFSGFDDMVRRHAAADAGAAGSAPGAGGKGAAA
jgi:HD-GYP domain-containing protein (c-di-GMP phosphodiesterase class II)